MNNNQHISGILILLLFFTGGSNGGRKRSLKRSREGDDSFSMRIWRHVAADLANKYINCIVQLYYFKPFIFNKFTFKSNTNCFFYLNLIFFECKQICSSLIHLRRHWFFFEPALCSIYLHMPNWADLENFSYWSRIPIKEGWSLTSGTWIILDLGNFQNIFILSLEGQYIYYGKYILTPEWGQCKFSGLYYGEYLS